MPELGSRPHHPTDCLHHPLHHVQTNATTRNLRHRLRRRETWQKQELHKFRFGQRPNHLGREPLRVDKAVPQVCDVHSPAIIRHGNVQHTCPMPRLQGHCPGSRFAGGQAFRRRLNAMINGVTESMRQGSLKLRQNIAIDRRRFPDQLERHLLA